MSLGHDSEAGEGLGREAAREEALPSGLSPEEQAAEDECAARLVQRFQAGDNDAFGELYSKYFERVFLYLRVILRRSHEAEDLAQQTFLRAFEALPAYELRGRPLRHWLFTIARNLAIDHLKRIQRIELVDPAELDRLREGPAGDKEDLLDTLGWITDGDLLIFVERLPLPQRQVLVLRFLLDQTDAQTAVILDRTPSDVRMLQSRALRFLRERLAPLGKGPDEDDEKPKKDPPKETRRARMRRAPRHSTVLRSRRWALWD